MLASRLGRQRAHDLVNDISRQASTSGQSLLDLAKLLDPAEYLGLSGEMGDSALSNRR